MTALWKKKGRNFSQSGGIIVMMIIQVRYLHPKKSLQKATPARKGRKK